jgi:hypothetical protein
MELEVSRQEEHSEDGCRHRLFGVVSVVSILVEGGYIGRCLLCGMTGPLTNHREVARDALLKHIGSEGGQKRSFSGPASNALNL